MSGRGCQITRIGLLACTLCFAAPSALLLRAEADTTDDRLTRTIRQLAQRDAPEASEPAPPREPEPPREPAAPTSSVSASDEPADVDTLAIDPNELRQLGPSGGGEGQVGDDPSRRAFSNEGGWVLQTLTALGIVIGLLLLLRWGWMRLSGTQGVAAAPVVEVLSRTPVAPRNHVLLLRVGPRILVVSDSSSGMRTLASVEDEGEVADLLAAINASRPESISRNFQQLLSRFGAAHDAESAEGWRAADDGVDDAEHLFDRTRNNVSGLAARIRSLSGFSGRGGGT